MKNIGTFEAHEENIMLDLWNELTKYYGNHNTKVGLDRIFYSVCDYLTNNEDSWLWGVVYGEFPTEDSVYSHINIISKQLEEYQQTYYKPIHNTYGEIIGYDKKPLIQDTHLYPKWDDSKTYKTPNKILVRYSIKNHIALKGLFTRGIIMSVKDFNSFSINTNLDLNTLTPPQLERLIMDWETTSHYVYWKQYPTMKSFNESLLVEKGITESNKDKKNEKYVIGKGLTQEDINFYKELDELASSIFTII